jgi:hypothetical protein
MKDEDNEGANLRDKKQEGLSLDREINLLGCSIVKRKLFDTTPDITT